MNWFKRQGIFFIPISLVGWGILIAAVTWAVYTFIEIDRNSHSVSDTLISFMINCVMLVVVYSAIGFFTHRKPHKEEEV